MIQARSVDEQLIRDLANTRKLCVVSDFDGTLTPLSIDPADQHVNKKARHALERLASLSHTYVTILSGRDLDCLAQISDFRYPIRLAGSHGAQSDHSTIALNQQQQHRLTQVEQKLTEIATGAAGAYVEVKPFHRVLHVRPVSSTTDRQRLLNEVVKWAERHPDVHLTLGNCIAEIAVEKVTKGTWITQEKETYHPDALIFVGDDTTDEDGFAALDSYDCGIKVGPGATAARWRVADIPAVADFFSRLYSYRSQALNR